MRKIQSLLFGLILILTMTGCAKEESTFWYPVKLKHVKCLTFEGEVYQMRHSRRARSWPYYLDPSDKVEVELPEDCTMRTIRQLPKHKWDVAENLTIEQQQYRVYGPVN